MARRGFIRNTRQRQAILEVLKGTDTHPTADWVYQEVRKQLPNVSLGTIYRNLRTLADAGEIMELCPDGSVSRFDRNPVNHYHFTCEECGRVFDIDVPVAGTLNKEAAEKSGHEIRNHHLMFYGICKYCKRSSKEARGDEVN